MRTDSVYTQKGTGRESMYGRRGEERGEGGREGGGRDEGMVLV